MDVCVIEHWYSRELWRPGPIRTEVVPMVFWLSDVTASQQGLRCSGKRCVSNGAYHKGTFGSGTRLLVMPSKRLLPEAGAPDPFKLSELQGTGTIRLVLSHLGRVFPL